MAERVALVIGNREYVKATALQSPARDATAVAEVLRRLEFQCGDLVLDADWNAFQKALRQFQQALDGASLAVFFYAGHSIQVQDVNYCCRSMPIFVRGIRSPDMHFRLTKFSAS
jgi:uncharacterized caspase-like protein